MTTSTEEPKKETPPRKPDGEFESTHKPGDKPADPAPKHEHKK